MMEPERCHAEIAEIERQLRSGHPDVGGLCLALADWWAELHMVLAETVPEQKSPPRPEPGGQWRRKPVLAPDRVHPLAVVALGGFDLQAQLLAEGAGHEPADGVGLPAGSFHQVGQGGALGIFQQGDNLGGLAALAGGRRAFLGFVRLFCRAGLTGRLALGGRNVARPWRNAGLFGGLWLLGRSSGLLGGSFFRVLTVHADSPSGGSYRAVRTFITPPAGTSKRILQKIRGGEFVAMEMNRFHLSARGGRW